MANNKHTRCFIVEDSKHDISTISRHGEIVYLYKQNDNKPSLWSAYKEGIVAKLKRYDFDPDNDYFACVGRQVPVIMSVAAIMEEYGGFRALFFNAPEQQYVPHELGSMYEPDDKVR
jgi:hypothetical protein